MRYSGSIMQGKVIQVRILYRKQCKQQESCDLISKLLIYINVYIANIVKGDI